MYENVDSFSFKPLTLYSFFPKNKRLNIAKKDNSNIVSNNNKYKILSDEKISKEKGKEKININKTKSLKFNNVASSTSSNFYTNHYNNENISKKNSFNYNNNYNSYNNYNFRSYSQKKYKQKDQKNKKSERIKSTGDSYLQYIQNVDNKEINEKFLEQFLENYDSKLQRNIKDMKSNYSNNNYYNYNLKANKNGLMKSSKTKNKINNDYMNSVRFKNVIRLNNERIYNYLPYLNSSSKDKKLSPKTQKKLLVYGNYDINTISAGFNPVNGSTGFKSIQKYYHHMNSLTITKNNNSNNINKSSKKNYFHASSNQVINSYNNNNGNNITSNSNISNTGNNNIIFNNVGSIGSITNNYNNIYDDDSGNKNNYPDEINRADTAIARTNNFDYNIFLKKSNKKMYDSIKNEAHKINDIEENINDNIKNIKEKEEKQKILRNFNFLKEEKEKKREKEKDREKNKEREKEENNINIKARALSTAPYKKRSKHTKKNTINIDCNNNKENKENQENKEEKENKEKHITDENINPNQNQNKNQNDNVEQRKKERLAKYEIGDSLGKGAYAIVKVVTNKITKEKYAMKIYDREKLNSNSKKNCVYKEIQILKQLKHKNIARLIEVISTDKQILIIQELVEGISLREYYNNEIRNQKGISIHKEHIFKIIFRQIFEAMDYIHKLGIAHRDIKLENILIKKNYEIKIIDFGFGMYNPENKLQKFFCGTPNYMPPEIAEKKPYNGQLADMWSLGILVYKIFCADFPFKGKDEKDLYKSIKTGKFTMANYTPDYARKIICSLIVLNPAKRMTCEEVLNSDWLREK